MTVDIEKILTQTKNEADKFDQAKLLLFLKKEKAIPVKELSKKLGYKQAYICNIMRLNRLPEIVKDGYYSHVITLSHLLIISRLKAKEQMVKAYEEVLSRSLTVQQTEILVRNYLYSIKTEGSYIEKKDLTDIMAELKKIDPDINIFLTQSRIRSRLILELRGSLKNTSVTVKSWLQTIRTWAINKGKP